MVFFGTPAFAAVQLQALLEMPSVSVVAVVTQPDRPAGRGQKLAPSPVKVLALSHNVPILQPVSLRKELESVKQFCAATGQWDIGVVAAYGLIVPQKILDLPGSGCVNVHASLLPRWRGAAPIHRAIIAGDTETGVCLMKMEAGLDTGPVFAAEKIAITEADNTGSLHDRLASFGAAMLKKHLTEILDGSREALPQEESGVTYAEKITKDEAALNWNKSAVEIARLVRGLNPSPGAFTMFGAERVKIWAARQFEASLSPIMVGDISPIHERLIIGCGDNTALEVLELQPAGRNRISAAQYLRGLNPAQLPKSVDL